MTSSIGTLVIGAGQAGLQLATNLRELGDTGSITLLGGESHPPYQRPPLSKAYLQGTMEEDGLALRGPEFYRDHRIDLICGEWIESLRLTDRETGAGQAITRSGRVLAFDRLALTTGGAPRRMRVPGAELGGIHYLREIADATRLRADLDGARHVVVVGGGFVGLEAAAAATAAGKNATVVEAADRLMARAVAPAVSAFYADAHRRRGTALLLGTAVAGFTGTGRVDGVELADGRVLPADVVVVGVGLTPSTRLAELIGLTCRGGIVVDDQARTSIPAIVAAGDCTVIAHTEHGSLRLESVQNAIAQAKIAAATLLGVPAPDTGVPWFWSDQADLKLQIAGLNLGHDQVVLRGEPDTERFSALYYRDGRLLSIDAVNAPRDYMAVRRILERGGSVPQEAASDTRIGLKDFVQAAV
ncbi:NAD(P)/FAD-dependent oxidoreductase [Nocardia takedensis]